MTMPFPDRKKRTMIQARRIFLAAALFLTAGLVILLFMRTANRPAADSVTVKPDIAALLPAEARGNAGVMLELFDVPAPSYIATYATKGMAHAVLIVWDKISYRYRLADDVKLSADAGALSAVTAIALMPLGGGAPTLIEVEGPNGGAYTDGVMLLDRQGDSLQLVSRVDIDGKILVAQFLRGASVKHAVDVAFEDVNDDGRSEAIVRSGETGDNGKETVDVSAFEWRDGAFRYSADLSWALSTSGRVFPSP